MHNPGLGNGTEKLCVGSVPVRVTARGCGCSGRGHRPLHTGVGLEEGCQRCLGEPTPTRRVREGLGGLRWGEGGRGKKASPFFPFPHGP